MHLNRGPRVLNYYSFLTVVIDKNGVVSSRDQRIFADAFHRCSVVSDVDVLGDRVVSHGDRIQACGARAEKWLRLVGF